MYILKSYLKLTYTLSLHSLTICMQHLVKIGSAVFEKYEGRTYMQSKIIINRV